MNCVCCGSAAVTERRELTARGYRRFRCRACGRQFNDRSTGVLNRTCLPSDVIAFGVLQAALPADAAADHGRRALQAPTGTRRSSGTSWYVDETYLKVSGCWCYLYRAIDRDGNLIDAMLSEHRDMKAAKAFFRSARAVMRYRPERVTTDGHGSYPRAIRSVLDRTVSHRTSAYMNNRLEQDHRDIKGRIRCMCGFKSHDTAHHFCREHSELRDLLRPRRSHNQVVSASLRRFRFARGGHSVGCHAGNAKGDWAMNNGYAIT